jgi:hypothetical protein
VEANSLPVGEVLTNLSITSLDPDDIPIAAIVLIVVVDTEGRRRYIERVTDGHTLVEALGQCMTMADTIRHKLMSVYEEDD